MDKNGQWRWFALAVTSVLLAGVSAVPAVEPPDGAGREVARAEPTLLPIPEVNLALLEPEVAEQLGQARASLQALVEAGERPGLARAFGELANVYHAYELYDAAEACYRNALSLEPGNYAWRYHLGHVYQKLGRFEDAVTQFAKALELSPDPALVQVRLGETQMLLGERDKARQAYLEALYLQPGAVAVLARLGEVALAEKRYELAVKYLATAVESQPEANRLYYMLGMAYRGIGQTDQARSFLAMSGPVGIQPPDPLADEIRSLVRGERLYLLRGRLAYAAGQYEAAAEAFRKAVAADERSARARINLGSALGNLNRPDEAIQAYREALNLEPDNLTARFNLGQLLLSKGSAKEAVEQLQAVVKVESDDAVANQLLAKALAGLGRREEAMEHYKKTVRIDPSAEDAWIGGTQLLIDLGRFEEAVSVLDQARKRLPASGRIAIALAKLLAAAPKREIRDGARAVPLAEEAYRTRPSVGYAEVLAMAHAETGNCEGAAELQQQALGQVEPRMGLPSREVQEMKGRLEHYRKGPPCRLP